MKNTRIFIKELIPYLLIVIIVLILKCYVFSTILVNGTSMENTLHDNDFMIINKIGIKINPIKRFDIVVIERPDDKLIKRIIGLPGETVEYKNNKLYINGKEVTDNYGKNETSDFGPIKLEDNQYYVLGDNRTVSIDSRYIGPINKNKILGKANLILYPFNRFGIKK